MALLRLTGVKEAETYFGRKGLTNKSETYVVADGEGKTVETFDSKPEEKVLKLFKKGGFTCTQETQSFSTQDVYDTFPKRMALLHPYYRLWAFVHYCHTNAEIVARFGEQAGSKSWNHKLLKLVNVGTLDIMGLIAFLGVPVTWIFGESISDPNMTSWLKDESDDSDTDVDVVETTTAQVEVKAEDTTVSASDTEPVEVVTDQVTPEPEVEPEVEQETAAEPVEVAPESTDVLQGDTDGDVEVDFDDDPPWATQEAATAVEDDQVDTAAEEVVAGPDIQMHSPDEDDAAIEKFLS